MTAVKDAVMALNVAIQSVATDALHLVLLVANKVLQTEKKKHSIRVKVAYSNGAMMQKNLVFIHRIATLPQMVVPIQ